jgi:hypothetical protein
VDTDYGIQTAKARCYLIPESEKPEGMSFLNMLMEKQPKEEQKREIL